MHDRPCCNVHQCVPCEHVLCNQIAHKCSRSSKLDACRRKTFAEMAHTRAMVAHACANAKPARAPPRGSSSMLCASYWHCASRVKWIGGQTLRQAASTNWLRFAPSVIFLQDSYRLWQPTHTHMRTHKLAIAMSFTTLACPCLSMLRCASLAQCAHLSKLLLSSTLASRSTQLAE